MLQIEAMRTARNDPPRISLCRRFKRNSIRFRYDTRHNGPITGTPETRSVSLGPLSGIVSQTESLYARVCVCKRREGEGERERIRGCVRAPCFLILFKRRVHARYEYVRVTRAAFFFPRPGLEKNPDGIRDGRRDKFVNT